MSSQAAFLSMYPEDDTPHPEQDAELDVDDDLRDGSTLSDLTENTSGADWSREGPGDVPENADCSWCGGMLPEWSWDFCSETCRSAAFADMRDDLAEE